MSASAAVMTGRGSGAIATVQLIGDSAQAVLASVFRRIGDKPLELTTGRILLGHVHDSGRIIDQVTVGCEAPQTFAIHCHGNPLIVERIMDLLQRCGVELVTGERLLTQALAARQAYDAIAVEAKLALTTVKTIEGAGIIVHQVGSGLSDRARHWQRGLDTVPLEQIAAEAEQILHDSEIARLILCGCTIALIGPPNTGKSTLLNTLAGRDKAIVTDIRGTTRDWVSAEIHIPPLAATVVDTAGLDPTRAAGGEIDRVAQQKTMEIIQRADLILLVLDISQSVGQLDSSLIDAIAGRRVVVVLNKADLPSQLDVRSLPPHLAHGVRISARLGRGIEDLVHAVHQACNLTKFPPDRIIAFTDRQRILISRLATATSWSGATASIAELLHGPIA